MSQFTKDWLKNIRKAKRREAEWRVDGDKIVDRYMDSEDITNNTYNILFSNTETLSPIIYNRTPNPVVMRTFKDRSPVAKDVSEVLERALDLTTDLGAFDMEIKSAIKDYLLAGRAQMRVKLVNKEKTQTVRTPVSEVEELGDRPVIEDDSGNFVVDVESDELASQITVKEYVHWKDFITSEGRRWSEVTWVGFRGLLTKEEFKQEYPNIPVEKVSFDVTDSGEDKQARSKATVNSDDGLTEVWEIWDKASGKQMFFSLGYSEAPLASAKDPLGLSGFFPCPQPLYSITSNDSLIPTPFYVQYHEQALELDVVSSRITALVDELKYRGVYDGSIKEMYQLFNQKDSNFVPLSKYSELAQKGGLESVVATLPIAELVGVIQSLYNQRQEILRSIYEIIGLGDIMRAKTDPNEGVGTQKLKANFGTLRTSDYQREVQRFIRDVYRIEGEMLAENVEPEMLSQMTGLPVSPEMAAFMKQDNPRQFRIDIETDSTVAADAAEERAEAVELVTALTQFATQAAPAITQQAGPQFTKEIFLTTFRKFKSLRSLEDLLESSIEAQEQAAQNQPPEPDAEVIKAQNEQQKLQLEQQKMVQDGQVKQAELQLRVADLQLKQNQQQIDQGKAISEAQQNQVDAAIQAAKIDLDRDKLALEARNPNKNVVAGF